MPSTPLERNDNVAELRNLATQGIRSLQLRVAELLRTDRDRLITSLYRLDVDETLAQPWLAASFSDHDISKSAFELANLIVRRLEDKLFNSASRTARPDFDPSSGDLAEPIDKPRCNCAVVGIYGNRNASVLAYQALYAMQHRGDESTGIVTSD